MLSDSLKKYREEAAEILVFAHASRPILEEVHNASSRTGLIRALKKAKLSLGQSKHRNNLDTLIEMVEADPSR